MFFKKFSIDEILSVSSKEKKKKIKIMHPAVKPISWLIGSWRGRNGHGHYPTIKSFEYQEEITITHPTEHQPVIHLE